ncbi:MAG: endo-1,4-beta-xylanase [Spirochaetota bacterium]
MFRKAIILAAVTLVALGSCATMGGGGDALDLDFVGNVYPLGVGPDAPGTEQWTQLTPENATKWSTVEPVRDEMNWGQADDAYAYAGERGIPFRFHTLIWEQQRPTWLEGLSSEEQLEEVMEWIQAAAERYPAVDFIDVVNEPVHETPIFADALGGAGETGYDWVIRSFEIAREYFPNSELHVNEYNILTNQSVIDEYIEIIELLNERGLVDGIGLQAHSLERADVDAVQDKLDRLAEIGLPIYITELEIALRNDVQQAEQFSALFEVFAEHPAVRGVTLWGSVENRMWRSDGYLIGLDGSYRPAMEWLVAYRNGESYEMPEYRATPRVGTAASNRLEAESFDEGEGVEPAGNTIAYVDGGDYIGFEAVEFRTDYTALRIGYAKGSETPSSVKVVLVSPDGYEAANVELEPTGGWSTVEVVEVEWPPTEGQYDVYLVFEGGEGVGNIDFVEFLQPNANPTLAFVDDSAADAEGGIQLQAEEADIVFGVETDDGMISYLDEGDYVAFEDVDFGAGVSRLLINYAKESDTKAGVEIRLDSLESEPIHLFQLNATGGWDAFKLVETPIPEISGVHDLYITFRLTDTTGVGNFDWFWFFPE